MNFLEHNRRLYHKLHINLLLICWILVPVILVLEFGLLVTRSLFPEGTQDTIGYFVKCKVVLPSVINLVQMIAATVILNSKDVRLRIKNWVSCFSVFILCSIVAFFHREYQFTVVMPCIPILFSTIYADKLLTFVVTSCGGIVMEFSVVLSLLSRHVTGPVLVLSIIVSVALLFCCVLVSRLMIRTSCAQMSFVFDAYSNQEEMIDELHIEPMTGLSNRAALDECLNLYIQKYLEGEFVPHLVLMDIDHFKSVNDTYGHNAGDVVIKNLAGIIKKNMKSIRRAFRFGGDEMVLLFGNESVDDIRVVVDNIRREFKSTKYNFQPDHEITLSVGVASYYKGLSAKAWFELADSVMYKSKESGRDAVNFTD